MSGVRGENKNRKPGECDSRYSMGYYYGLLSGSLLMVGGLAGTRFIRMSRFSIWSFFLYTTSVTGMYLTLSSIRRLYNSVREPICKEPETPDRPFEHSQVHENFDKNTKNPLHVTESVDNKTSDDNIVENVADEKTDELSVVLADIDVNSEETNIIEDSTNQYGSNEVISLQCKSSTNIAPEKVVEGCTNTQDLVAGGIKDVEVVTDKAFEIYEMKEAIAKRNNNLVSQIDTKGYIEVMAVKDGFFNVVDVNASAKIKNIVADECFEKDMKKGENESNSKDNNINLSLVDCVTKSEYNYNSVTLFKEYKIKDPIIENIIATNINIPEIVAADDLTTDKFDKDIMTNEIIDEDSITQEAEYHKFMEKNISFKIVEGEDYLTEIEFDNVVKEAKLAEKQKIIDCPLTEDVRKSKLFEESKIHESEDDFINEGERKEMTAKEAIFQYTITAIEKDVKENEIGETSTKDIDIESLLTENYLTGNTLEIKANENNEENVSLKGICTERSMDSDVVNEDEVLKDTPIIKIIEDIKVSGAQERIENDAAITNPVVEDDVNESKLGKDCMATSKKDMVKGAYIEEITETFESLQDSLYKNGENQDKLNMKDPENILQQECIIAEQTNEVTGKDIFETSMVKYGVDDNTLVKEMDENESREMHMNIGNIIPEEGVDQGEFGMEIRKKYLDESLSSYNAKDSKMGIISKDISIKERAFNDVIEDKLSKDDLKMEVLEKDVKNKTRKDAAKNVTTIDVLFENEVCVRNLSENITALEDNNIIQDGVKENVVTKRINIEDNVVKPMVEESLSGLGEEELENMFIKNAVVEDGIRKDTVDKDISACDIDSKFILVDKTTLIKDTESQNERKVEATIKEQNVDEFLKTEFFTAMSQTELPPNLADNPAAQHINQLLSNSTDELRFISPNRSSSIGVFFRKSNKTRLAAQFPNTTKPLVNRKDSKYSFSKKSIKTSVVNFFSTNQALKASSNVAVSTSVETSTTSRYSTSPSVDRDVIVDPKHCQSAGKSSSSVLFLNNQTCSADLPTGQFSSDSESIVVSQLSEPDLDALVLSALPNHVKQDISHSIQSSNILDMAFISSPDRHLSSPDITTISPVISDLDAPISAESQKSSSNISGSPVSHLPNPFGSP